jgi:hypothetical protein
MCDFNFTRVTQLRAVILGISFLTFVRPVLPLQSHHAENSTPADILCATMNTQFNEGRCRCIHIAFSGEVSAEKKF